MRKPWEDRPDGTPAWVWAFTDLGRPLMTLVVLVICAPGEHHLAVLAGWNVWLAWGMASLLAAYAGIAAVVATVRPRDAKGKRSAVAGAVLALLLGMGAQPVSHLFTTGWLSATPRAPIALVITVSCIPPLVLGHLLHLAASPDGRRAGKHAAGHAVLPAPRTEQTDNPQPVDNVADNVADKTTADTVSVQVAPRVRTDNRVDTYLDKVTDKRTDNVPDNVRPIRTSAGQTGSMASVVRELADKGLSRKDIVSEIKDRFPDAKADTVNRTLNRAGVRSA